ncbi:MAG: hypothetical protein ACOYXN_06170 [Acidobacteriota bacterium]
MAGETPEERILVTLTVGPLEKAALAEAAKNLGMEEAFRRAVAPKGKRFAVALEEEEWEEIAGLLSVTSNRARDPEKQKLLDALIERIEDALLVDPEDDEES